MLFFLTYRYFSKGNQVVSFFFQNTTEYQNQTGQLAKYVRSSYQKITIQDLSPNYLSNLHIIL